MKRTIKILIIKMALFLVACVATPLPYPPEIDPQKIHLSFIDGQRGSVTFEGKPQSTDPEFNYSIQNISNLNKATTIKPNPDGSFKVDIKGLVIENFRIKVFKSNNWIHLFDCNSDGNGGIIIISDQDADLDGYDIVHDCNDENSLINPAQTEICNDIVDNDCDGIIDEQDCTV